MVPATVLTLGDRTFDISDRALVMGILNRTPDSFYDKGATFALDELLRRAEQLVDDGADLLDVGGVKAGPGPEVGEAEELDRVIPALERLRARFDTPLSVDTWRASVAAEAYAVGAVVGNDISGFADPGYLPAAAAAGATVVATHIRLGPRIPDPDPVYDDVVESVAGFLVERGSWARAAGITPDRIVARRRPRPREDGRAVARPCCGRRTGSPGSATRCCCRRRTRPSSARCSTSRSTSGRRPRWRPPPWAQPSGAGSCGSTMSPPTGRCAR